MSRLRTIVVWGLALGGLVAPAAGQDRAVSVAVSTAAAAAPSGAAEGEAGGHGAADINPLSWEAMKADLAIWTGAVFLILLLVLWKFAWGPIAEGLDKREQRIAADIRSAQEANEQAKAQLAAYQEKLAAAGQEVQQMLEDARRQAEQVGQELVAKAREEAEAEHQRALAEIDQATAAALKELAQRSADLAIALAGKIVGAQLDQAAHARLIEEAVSGFTRTKASRN